MEKSLGILAVGLGGFVGAVLRYLVSLWTAAKGWTAFPWTTLIADVTGCFLIDGEQILIRIFIGESDRWHHTALTTRCSSACAGRVSLGRP